MWLEQAVERGATVRLTEEHWAWALLLGEARRLSNEGKRAANADRSADGNRAVDLLGALAELFLLRKAIEFGAGECVDYIREHIFAPDGGAGVTGPDARILNNNGEIVCLDAKTFQAGSNRKFFAINDRKHRELFGECNFYFCVLVKRFGEVMIVARLVPYDDVSHWECYNLMRGGKGSPSRNLGIDEFSRNYCSTPDALFRADSGKVFDEKSVHKVSRDVDVMKSIREMLPNLPIGE